MTFRIEKSSNGETTVFEVSGRFEAEHIEDLRAEIEKEKGIVALDLHNLTHVDLEAVRYFEACESKGIDLRQCAGYIRQWILAERGKSGKRW